MCKEKVWYLSLDPEAYGTIHKNIAASLSMEGIGGAAGTGGRNAEEKSPFEYGKVKGTAPIHPVTRPFSGQNLTFFYGRKFFSNFFHPMGCIYSGPTRHNPAAVTVKTFAAEGNEAQVGALGLGVT